MTDKTPRASDLVLVPREPPPVMVEWFRGLIAAYDDGEVTDDKAALARLIDAIKVDQPPALSGEPIKRYHIHWNDQILEQHPDGNFCKWEDVAPLLAELGRMNQQFDELAAAVGFSKDRCEQAGDSPLDCAQQLKARITELEAGQPAAAKVDEEAEFEAWRKGQIASLIRMGYPDAAKAFRDLGSIHWAIWQARAKLNGTAK